MNKKKNTRWLKKTIDCKNNSIMKLFLFWLLVHKTEAFITNNNSM